MLALYWGGTVFGKEKKRKKYDQLITVEFTILANMKRWPDAGLSVVDCGPTLAQHWVYVSCLLGRLMAGVFQSEASLLFLILFIAILF